MEKDMTDSTIDDIRVFEEFKRTGNKEFRNQIVEKYLYIVDILVKKYLNKGVEYDDLYQVGSMALVLAAERYDPDSGNGFTAYATPTILGEIKRYFRDKGWAMKVPRRLKDISVKINKVQQELETKLNRAPKVAEIAEALGEDEDTVLEAMESGKAYSAYSLQQSMDEDDKESSGPSFIERYTGEEDSGFNTLENADFLKRTMQAFSPEEKRFCSMRFIEGKTQQQIAEELGVSQMTVSRIEKKIKSRFKEEYTK